MDISPLYYKKIKRSYKYKTSRDFICLTDIFPESEIKTDYIRLTVKGILTIYQGYAWDGATGVSDNKRMRSSLVHDAFYQLMRLGLLDYKKYKKPADVLFIEISKFDGDCHLLAWRNLKGLEWFGQACIPREEENIEYVIGG